MMIGTRVKLHYVNSLRKSLTLLRNQRNGILSDHSTLNFCSSIKKIRAYTLNIITCKSITKASSISQQSKMSDLVTRFQSMSLQKTVASGDTEPSRENLALAQQWQDVAQRGELGSKLSELNNALRDRSFLTSGSQPTEADVVVFEHSIPVLEKELSAENQLDVHSRLRHVLRWAHYLQNLLQLENPLAIDTSLELPREIIEKPAKPAKGSDPKAQNTKTKEKKGKGDKGQDNSEKVRGKPDEATLAKLREEAKARKAAKKEANKPANQSGQQAAVAPTVSMIDFRVGFIERAIKHPDADSLYVSTIDVGDAEGPRTVCSGLVKHFSLEDMQQRRVVVVCNLKPVNMRGIKSTAMVLCGSDESTGRVEFVEPPKDAKAGDRVFFEGHSGEPLSQLNPKKKIWETFQPHFTTNEKLEVVFREEGSPDCKLTTATGGEFHVATIADAQVR